MLSNSLNKAAFAAVTAALLGGCAAPAPDLPRHTNRTIEPGYTAATASAQVAMPAGGTVAAPSRRLAVVSKLAWGQLSAEERESIASAFEVSVLAPDSYGTITDVQGSDQSSPGTNSGAMLGGAIGSAAYIDRAFSGGNSYSAGANLAVGLLGAMLGSALDRAPESKFQFRYTVKQGDGEIQYFDEVKSTGFRHSPGVCVTLPALTLVSQQVCNQTPESLRTRYIADAN